MKFSIGSPRAIWQSDQLIVFAVLAYAVHHTFCTVWFCRPA